MEIYESKKKNERKEKNLVSFYSNLIKEDDMIDVYSYMKCYYYINDLPEKYKESHLRALHTARENFEKNFENPKVKKLIK